MPTRQAWRPAPHLRGLRGSWEAKAPATQNLRGLLGFLLLATLAGAAWAQSPQPFSHRIHLKLKLQCTDCHTAATRSTRADDNLLPAKEVCLKCHKEAAIPRPPKTPLNRFNHALHLKLGNIAPVLKAAIDSRQYLSPSGDIRAHLNGSSPCQACHRGLEESDAVTQAALPRMADCLVCHAQIDPPYSCGFCHDKTMMLTPASHIPGFVDTHSRKNAALDKTTCAVCHGRKFTCAGCH